MHANHAYRRSRLTSCNQQSRASNRSRHGAVTLEMALVVPLLIASALGICELAQVQKDHFILTEAAYAGCVRGSQPGSSNSAVISDVHHVLNASHMTASAATITIRVNNFESDVASARRNDKVSVTVALPLSATPFGSSHFFLSTDSIISKTMVIMRQG